MGAGIAVALILVVGTVYGMSRWPTPQQGAYSGAAGGVPGGSYSYGGGMMGGYGGYGGYGGMMGGYGGMMGGYGFAGPSTHWGGMMGPYWYGFSNGPNGNSYPYWGGMMGGYGYASPSWNGTAGGAHVVIFRNGFYPTSLTVSNGTTVTWTNMDSVQHTVTSGSEQSPTNLFDSHELGLMQSYSHTFNTPGTYSYFCDVHPYMTGTITVTA